MEYLLRFFIGGIIVSAFAIVSDIFRPRTFSGLFGAALTVALATFGSTLTVITGIITMKYGPGVGGLFLAFPSIFPASLTLAQSHKQKKEGEKGQSEIEGQEEGEESACKTAIGASLGSSGLILFGLMVWKFSDWMAPWLVLLIALAGWLGAAILTWWIVTGKNVHAAENLSQDEKIVITVI
jgi:MFS family permease